RPTIAVDDNVAVADGEHALQVRAVDLDAGKARSSLDVVHAGREGFDFSHGRHGARIRDATRAGKADEVDGRRGVARLPAGLAIDLTVQHDDGEIFRLLQADSR